jgi:hypothetical protein
MKSIAVKYSSDDHAQVLEQQLATLKEVEATLSTAA